MSRPWMHKTAMVLAIGVLAATSIGLSMVALSLAESVLDLANATVFGIALLLALYVVLLSIPFVPGAEIGLALMIVFGSVMAWPIYVATVLGLSIAFAVGRLASRYRASALSGTSQPTKDALTQFAKHRLRRRWLRPVLRFRWLAVVVLINTPGNSIIGGGGGIAMAIGFSRTFTFPVFLASTAVAVAPVPALVLLAEVFGLAEFLNDWMKTVVQVPIAVSGTS